MSEAQPAYDAAKRIFSKRLGKATCRGFVDGEACVWKTKQLRTTLRLRTIHADLLQSTGAWFGQVELEYADPSAKDGDGDRLTSTETTRHADPKRWSELAVNGIHLGMGVGDVVDRIKPTTHFSSFVCRKGGDGSKVRCEQKAGLPGEMYISAALFTTGGQLYWASIDAEPQSHSEAQQALDEVTKAVAPMLQGGRVHRSESSFSGETSELEVHASYGYLEEHRKWYFGVWMRSRSLDPAKQAKGRERKSSPPTPLNPGTSL